MEYDAGPRPRFDEGGTDACPSPKLRTSLISSMEHVARLPHMSLISNALLILARYRASFRNRKFSQQPNVALLGKLRPRRKPTEFRSTKRAPSRCRGVATAAGLGLRAEAPPR